MKKAVMVFLWLAILLCALIMALYLARGLLVKNLLVSGVEKITGLEVNLDSVSLDLLSSSAGVKGLVIRNPQGFPEPLMVNIPDFYVRYDLPALLKGKVHLPQLRLHLEEFYLSRNKQGLLNVSALQALQPKGSGPAPVIQIDKLDLRIGKVGFKDYSLPVGPVSFARTLDLKEHLEGITDAKSLIKLILDRLLKGAFLDKLHELDLSGLQEMVSGKAAEMGAAATGAAEEAKAGVQELKDSAEKTVETLKETGKDLKKLFETETSKTE